MTASDFELRCHTPQAFRCLGLRLEPLTIGHIKAMRLMGCDSPQNPGDLGTAVLICATPQEKAIPRLNAWWMKGWLWLWKRLLGTWDFPMELARFHEYVAWNTELPMISRKGEVDNTPASAVPFDRFLRSFLMSKLHVRHADLDGMLYLEALWLFVAWASSEARIHVHDTSEAEIDEQIAAIDWEEIARRGAELFEQPNPENQ